MRKTLSSSHRRIRTCAASESGFGLAEVMVSLGLLLLVLAGTFTAFDDARRASLIGTMVADGNQSLRGAVVLMTRDIIQTGREIPLGGIPIPQGAGVTAIRRPGPPGTAIYFPSTWTTLPALSPANGVGPAINGVATDMVTVLYADPTLALNQYPLIAILNDGSRMTVDSRTDIGDERTGIRAGDLILFTNALGNAIQTVTSVNGPHVNFESGSPADKFNFNQRTATSGSIMQLRGASPPTFPTTSATRVTMVSYYIDTTTATGQNRLMRQESFHNARLVGEGIENLQFTYDLVDGTVNPSNQPDATSPYSPAQIRKVNLYAARRSDLALRQTGEPVRSSVSTQVALRSMSFMDRYK